MRSVLRRTERDASTTIHPTAIIEPDVAIGAGTTVWDNVHIRGATSIGRDCLIGEKTYIAYGVVVGNYVKINAHVYVCTGITIEDRVMLSAGVVFTNDRFPRAFGESGLFPSEPTAETLTTVVREGATLGARVVVGPGIEIGRYAMLGMGSVVTHDVPAHALAYGAPARVHGWVCECGHPLSTEHLCEGQVCCDKCDRKFRLQWPRGGAVRMVAACDAPGPMAGK